MKKRPQGKNDFLRFSWICIRFSQEMCKRSRLIGKMFPFHATLSHREPDIDYTLPLMAWIRHIKKKAKATKSEQCIFVIRFHSPITFFYIFNECKRNSTITPQNWKVSGKVLPKGKKSSFVTIYEYKSNLGGAYRDVPCKYLHI